MKICPCKGCEDRKYLCHSMCVKYKAWKAEIEKASQEKAKEQDKWNNPKRPQRYKRRMRAK